MCTTAICTVARLPLPFCLCLRQCYRLRLCLHGSASSASVCLGGSTSLCFVLPASVCRPLRPCDGVCLALYLSCGSVSSAGPSVCRPLRPCVGECPALSRCASVPSGCLRLSTAASVHWSLCGSTSLCTSAPPAACVCVSTASSASVSVPLSASPCPCVCCCRRQRSLRHVSRPTLPYVFCGREPHTFPKVSLCSLSLLGSMRGSADNYAPAASLLYLLHPPRQTERRKFIKQDNPGIALPDVTRIIARMWHELPQAEKAVRCRRGCASLASASAPPFPSSIAVFLSYLERSKRDRALCLPSLPFTRPRCLP